MVTVDDDDDDDDPSFYLFSNTFFLSPFILQDPLKSTDIVTGSVEIAECFSLSFLMVLSNLVI
jgi:hypothetical protein